MRRGRKRRRSRRRMRMRKEWTLGALANPDGKEGKAERGRLQGWRAKGPGQFNGPFVYTVRPPVLLGRHTHQETHTSTQTHTQSLRFLISTPSFSSPSSLFHWFALELQL